jgi:hypothetical protein
MLRQPSVYLRTEPEVRYYLFLERVVQDLQSRGSMETRDCYLTPSLSRCISGREGNTTSPVGYGAGPSGIADAHRGKVP